jgi:hypothetical protein
MGSPGWVHAPPIAAPQSPRPWQNQAEGVPGAQDAFPSHRFPDPAWSCLPKTSARLQLDPWNSHYVLIFSELENTGSWSPVFFQPLIKDKLKLNSMTYEKPD